ncbi:MAG TPA: tRNA (adenosine(37)-N6)-threonylcarbamoyltransferase complex ATPase subunit type 1 TsaE [Candidatus Krumholzibacteria bacterium]|nr:tRNA (adenosine(37)-N6)-threonylcarbamoyltransferase complex ATPase subunit type 1 TsaE [Candidatus Krumholzibacteria bacterium]
MRRTPVYSLRTATEAETERLGAALGARIRGGVSIAISGPLGAGKTVLVRGLCRGLDVEGDIVSPTFILLEMLDGRLPIAHLDLYRLEHERELDEIGVFDLLGGDTVVLVEWGERSPSLLDAVDMAVRIDPDGVDARRIFIDATPEAAAALGDQPW